MMTRHFFYIFVPAILFLSLIFFVRIIQYQPLDQTTETPTEIAVQKTFSIPIFPEDPIVGLKNASKTIIVFGDFSCENCAHEYDLLKQIMQEYPNKVKIVWKGLPIKTVPFNSETAQKHGFCANKQHIFEAWIDAAFAHGESLDDATLTTLGSDTGLDTKQLATCLESKETADYIQKTKDLAQVLNIQSVPTLFFNNAQIASPQTIEEWKTLLSL